MASIHSLFMAWVLIVVLASCGANSGSAGPAAQPGPLDASTLGSADAGAPGAAGDAPDSAQDSAPADDTAGAPEVTSPDDTEASPDVPTPSWLLPPCYRACDRVVSCAVDACEGWSWASAGQLFEPCFQACTGHVTDLVLSAPTCASALDAARPHVPVLDAQCAQSPCQQACKRLSDCTVEQCPSIGVVQGPGLEAGCYGGCTPQGAAWVLQAADCAALVDALSAGDPAFAASCGQGAVDGCAAPEQCDAWAQKLTGCMLEHCGAPVEPWADGVAQLVEAFCLTAPGCPPAADIASVLQPAVTCGGPALESIGPAPPFTAVCEGTVGATPAQATAACEALLACPATASLGPLPKCAAQLATLSDGAARIACLLGAAGCPQVYACLEGL